MTNVDRVEAFVTVLVVDDDDDFRGGIVRILTRCGYMCLEAATSAGARAVLEAERSVAVVLCDISMPDISGIDLLGGLIVEFADLAVVMMTGVDDPGVAQVAFELGAFGYLTKPFDTNELLINLAGALRRRSIQMAQRARVQALEDTIARTATGGGVVDDGDPNPALESIRVLVVDDHEIFAQSLVRLLASKPELEVVGCVGSVSTAVAAVLAHEPDVVLMDFGLPDGDGPEATEKIKALMPSVKVIMLTVRIDDDAFVRAIAAGCSGFVKKEDSVDELLQAIVAAHDGDTIRAPIDLAPLLRQLRPTRRGLGTDLTPRELETLELIATGLANKQIARRLGVRLNTVRNHAQSILHKLHAHSRLEAVATAVREGIVTYPPDPTRGRSPPN